MQAECFLPVLVLHSDRPLLAAGAVAGVSGGGGVVLLLHVVLGVQLAVWRALPARREGWKLTVVWFEMSKFVDRSYYVCCP